MYLCSHWYVSSMNKEPWYQTCAVTNGRILKIATFVLRKAEDPSVHPALLRWGQLLKNKDTQVILVTKSNTTPKGLKWDS